MFSAGEAIKTSIRAMTSDNAATGTIKTINRTTYLKGALLTTLGGMCWGLSGTMGQYLFDVQGMDARWLVPIRLGLAGLFLLLYSMIRTGPAAVIKPWKEGRDRRDLVVYGLLGVSFCQFFYFQTIQFSSAAIGTIMQDLAPVFILIYSCIAARRSPKIREILAIILALAGVTLLTTHGDFTDPNVSAAALVCGILSGFCAMIYNVVPGRLMSRYPIMMLQGWAFLMGSITFTLLFHSWTILYVPNAIGIFGICFVALVGNVLAFPLYMQGVKLIGPEKGILYGFSEPLTAAVIGVLFLGNPVTAWDILGFAAVFAMLTLISTQNRQAS